MITLIDIQKRLAEVIKQSGMTQSALAEKLGVKQQQISCYIKGIKMPALDTLANLCAILDVDTNDILCIDLYGKERKTVNITDSFNNFTNNGSFKI